MSNAQLVWCKVCGRTSKNEIAGICNSCTSKIFSNGYASLSNTMNLLNVSSATLKRLDMSGQLIASRNEHNSRIYSRESLDKYIASKGESFASGLIKLASTDYLESIDYLENSEYLNIPSRAIISMCEKCDKNKVYDYQYCEDCLNDFISKSKAATILGLPLRTLEMIIAGNENILKVWPYNSQVRLSRREVTLLAIKSRNNEHGLLQKWSSHFTKCRVCKTTQIEHYGGGYCLECYPKSNETKILHGYLNGKTLAEVGRDLGMSRERARQLFNKALEIDTLRIDSNPSSELRSSIAAEIHSAYLLGKSIKEYKNEIENRYEDIVKLITTNNITSERSMLRAVGLPPSAIYVIQEEYSEFLELLSANEDKWSWQYDACKNCGTTSTRHARWGYCKNCFASSPEHRAVQYRYRMNNYEEFRKKQKAYESKYHKRPEVKKRMIENSYNRRYEGRREKAIELAGEKCQDCSMSRIEHKEKYAEDLSVLHIDGDVSNNEQDNLAALCRSCRSKRVYKTFRDYKQ